MSTHVVTSNPVRSDVAAPAEQPQATRPTTHHRSRGWALAGLGAAVTSIVGTGGAIAVNAVYDRSLAGDAPAILEQLSGDVTDMLVFHVGVSLAAVLLGVFGVGLHRRLRASAGPASLAPALAGFGLLATSVVLVMGTALDTEFVFGVAHPESLVPEAATFYNHWIGTVPGCWMLVGLSGLAMFHLSRRGRGVPRWLGLVGLVLGGLTLLVGISPLQYMAAMTGAIWLLVTSIGLLVGDKAFRRS